MNMYAQHSRSLIRDFTGSSLDSQGCNFTRAMDVQADLSPRWGQMSEGTFSNVAPHFGISVLWEPIKSAFVF